VRKGDVVAILPIVGQEHRHFGALRQENIGGADADWAVIDAGGGGNHSDGVRDVVGLDVQPNQIEGLGVGPEGTVITNYGCFPERLDLIITDEQRDLVIVAKEETASDIGFADEPVAGGSDSDSCAAGSGPVGRDLLASPSRRCRTWWTLTSRK
jgi:hypothetical protein